MSNSPLISVVMAVHNGQRHLAEAVESILGQTLRDFELLIVDDLSSDETPAMLQAFAARDDRVRLLRNTVNLGPYPSANRALEQARGTFIARMDADDIAEPERLERQASFMQQSSKCLLLGSGYRSIDAEGRTRFVKHNPLTFDHAAFTARLTMPMVHPGFFFRKKLPGGEPVRYDESYRVAADFALAARLGNLGAIASLGEPLIRYRMHAGNISTTRLDRQRAYARAISGDAVARHYSEPLVPRLQPLLDLIHCQVEPDRALVKQAITGMNAMLAQDGGSSPPGWMRQRAAGILAEACLGGIARSRAASLAPVFMQRARHHLVPLAQRLGQLRNWLPQAEEPTP